MKEVERIATLIGEFVVMEIEDVEDIEYLEESQDAVAFIVIMRSGKEYLLTVKEKI